MNKSYLIHGGWAIVAAATFTLGSKRSDSSAEMDDEADANSTLVSSSRSAFRRSGGDRINEAGDRRSRRSRDTDSQFGEDLPAGSLSEAEILQLGKDLKAARGPLERREIFSEILRNLTPENARLMREQIVHLDTNSSEFREFHYAWGSLAGGEAVLHGAETRERDMATTLAGWASADPQAALAYFNGLDKDAQGGSGLKWGAVYGLFDADPNLAVRFAMDQQAAGDREAGRLMDLVARQMLRSGDPTEAATWASGLPAGEMQDTAIARVAREYADKDPLATLDWADNLPDGGGKNRAYRESFSELARSNPQEAARRLESMGDSSERDNATRGFASRIAWEDPQTGIEWANTISDEGTRTRALVETGRAYFRKDPEGARQWLATSGLNKEQQQDITRRGR